MSKKMESIGTILKNTREKKNIPLEQVSQITKIPLIYLQAIEHEQYQLLPQGIFAKGFLKSYADTVGVDSNEILDIYKTLSNEKQIIKQIDPPKTDSTQAKTFFIIGFSIILLITGIILFYLFL